MQTRKPVLRRVRRHRIVDIDPDAIRDLARQVRDWQDNAYRREALLAGLISEIAPIFGYTAFQFRLCGYVSTLFKLSALMTVIWSRLL